MSTLTYRYNLQSKFFIKKLIFISHFIKNSNKISTNSSTNHKNTILQSPFHFKTVKTHLSAPTLLWSLPILNRGFITTKVGSLELTTWRRQYSLKL